MACEQPRKIVNRRYKDMRKVDIIDYAKEHYGMAWPPDYTVEVPCGYCHSCQKSANNQYRIRLLHEIRCYPPGSCLFVTLTFDDENLIKFKSDYNKAVRLFLDRLRKNYGHQIRHWFIGEFGTLHGRPHYHGILFDVPDVFKTAFDVVHPGRHPLLAEGWKYGFVFVGYVSDATCGYITKYLTKSINGKNRRPRVISSKGIGASYLDSDEAKMHRLPGNFQPFMVLNGFKQAMPRYYYNKIFTDFDKENMILERYLNPPLFFDWKGVRYSDDVDFAVARNATFEVNKSIGLTPLSKPPTLSVFSSFDRFKKTVSEIKEFE